MNLTGLHELLDERSAQLPSVAEQRVAAVGLRVRRLRRRRVVAVAAAVFAVLVAAGSPVVLGRGHARPPLPAASPLVSARLIDGFPEWAEGSRVVVTGDGALVVGGQLRVTVPGNALGHTFFARCEPISQNADVLLRWEWDGQPLFTATCSAGSPTATSIPADDPHGNGGLLTVTVVSVGTDVGSLSGPDATAQPGTSALHGGLAIAVGKIVPFDEYPLPPRPTDLVDLDSGAVRDDLDLPKPSASPLVPPADPLAPVTVTVTVGEDAWINLVAQTPGTITLTVDGGQPSVQGWWDYSATVHRVPVPAGAHTVSLTPGWFTGKWRAVIDKG